MLLDQKEKLVMSYLFDICADRSSHLIAAEEIIKFVSDKKHALSLSELDDIMQSLQKDSYIDFVASDSKKGTIYCTSLKSKGYLFKKDLQKEKKQARILVYRTIGLAVLSFIVGIILKAIFS